MNKFLIIISFVFFISNVLAYQPAKNIETLQIQSIEKSSLIFLGEPISIDWAKNLVTFKIFDIFKGDYKLDTIVFNISFEENIGFFSQQGVNINYRSDTSNGISITNPVDRFDSYKGLWIIYLYNKDSQFHLYRDLSRSMQHPERLFIWPYIDKLNDTNYDKHQLRIDAINDWLLEIQRLKKIRATKMIDTRISSEYWIVISIILSVVNLIILIYLLITQKASH